MARNRVRKLYLDSAFANEGSGSDISFQLPVQVPTQRGDALALTSMSFPNVFSSITANYNDRFYYETLAADEDLLPIHRCCYLLQPGTYSGDTLAAEIQAALVRSGKGRPKPDRDVFSHGRAQHPAQRQQVRYPHSFDGPA
jgi:hypothetical protein